METQKQTILGLSPEKLATCVAVAIGLVLISEPLGLADVSPVDCLAAGAVLWLVGWIITQGERR